ncbi:MAG: histidine--tRNA ligase [Bacteroidetes bacterium]|nr:histidine--tRNA ligase [Bacteroidota bacterium]
MSKPGLPQGTRDFGAEVVRKRNYIFNTIKNVFELYGFQPLETPAMENLETLMGKYGEEGDKLIFKILNNGLDNPSKHQKAKEDFEKVLEGKNVPGITERALRYDLTIPFARYVAMNHGQLTFPYKRYQMQPVWRADRPQKGRYREFYQCDADLVGSNSLLSDVEFANIYADVFKRLGIDVEIKINNRKILTALAEACGTIDKLTDITVAIDKLDKIGIDKVKEELSQRGLNGDQVSIIEKYLSINGSNVERLSQLKNLLGENITGKKGIEELEFVLLAARSSQLTADFTLARGLNYYTGIIFEVKAKNVSIGSIGGGGRYDDLTGLFGVPNIPGVGISFGVDRIYDVMEELKLFPEAIYTGTKVLFFNLGEAESKIAFSLMQQLRENNISSELFHETAKFDKQFKYADKKNIPFIVIIGDKELRERTCNIKKLATGEQKIIKQDELVEFDWEKNWIVKEIE